MRMKGNRPQLVNRRVQDYLSKELDFLKNKFDEQKLEFNRESSKLKSQIETLKNELKSIPVNTPQDKLEGSVTKKIVKRKLNGYKKELEFIELSTKIYILDDGYRKLNPPYVTMSSKGIIEGKPEPGAQKMRCYVIKKLVIPGYYKEDDFMSDDNFLEFFGKTYRELVAHMAEHNYHHDKNEMYCLNFQEI